MSTTHDPTIFVFLQNTKITKYKNNENGIEHVHCLAAAMPSFAYTSHEIQKSKKVHSISFVFKSSDQRKYIPTKVETKN